MQNTAILKTYDFPVISNDMKRVSCNLCFSELELQVLDILAKRNDDTRSETVRFLLRNIPEFKAELEKLQRLRES